GAGAGAGAGSARGRPPGGGRGARRPGRGRQRRLAGGAAVKRFLAALVLLCLAPVPAAAIPGTVSVLRDAGPPENRIDLVIVAEGYRDVDLPQFRQDADTLAAAIFEAAPWSDYVDLFNVKRLEIASNERGA